jgi:hypothetical protein
MNLSSFIRRTPRFAVGDEVRVVTPGSDKNKTGAVTVVTEHAGDFVHRYEVRFSDGTSKRYFGFELEPVLSQSA